MMRHVRVLALSLLTIACVSAATRDYDVVIAGAGAGGVAAALQSARMGARVALLEEADWIGGQMTAAGVSTMDEAGWNDQSGIYAEFLDRLRVHYGRMNKTLGACYSGPRKICFEPSAGRRILTQMIEDVRRRPAVLDLMLRTRVVRVVTDGNRIAAAVTSAGDELRTRVLIDATEYGDVIPLTPARYRIGRFTGENQDPGGCVQSITYTAIIRRYADGVPANLWMNNPPPGYTDAVRARFAKSVPREDPHTSRCPPCSWRIHNRYRGVPDSLNPSDYDYDHPERITKTGINLANDMEVKLDIFDRSKRRAVECRAKLLTIQFLYYVQHELGEQLWSVAREEGYDTPYNREENSCPEIPAEFKAIERNMPVMPYVRESRRLIGPMTFAAPQLQRAGVPAVSTTWFASSIAVGEYPMDLHGCTGEANMETPLEHWTDRTTEPPFRYGTFQVPFESLMAEGVDGLLAAEKNLSQSRLVNGSTRLQPIAMHTGQAAGALAGLAATLKAPPRAVPVTKVQAALLRAGCSLLPVPFVDVPRQSPNWPITQMVAVHRLMEAASPHAFDIWSPLSRGALNRILAAFPNGRPTAGSESEAVSAKEFTALISAATGHKLPASDGTPMSRGRAASVLAKMLETGDYCHPSAK
jgi:hypothetical protein